MCSLYAMMEARAEAARIAHAMTDRNNNPPMPSVYPDGDLWMSDGRPSAPLQIVQPLANAGRPTPTAPRLRMTRRVLFAVKQMLRRSPKSEP